MTSLGETYEKLMKFIRFFVNRAPGPQSSMLIRKRISSFQSRRLFFRY